MWFGQLLRLRHLFCLITGCSLFKGFETHRARSKRCLEGMLIVLRNRMNFPQLSFQFSPILIRIPHQPLLVTHHLYFLQRKSNIDTRFLLLLFYGRYVYFEHRLLLKGVLSRLFYLLNFHLETLNRLVKLLNGCLFISPRDERSHVLSVVYLRDLAEDLIAANIISFYT